MTQHWQRLLYRIGGSLAPKAAGRLAFDRFCRPPRALSDTAGDARLSETMRPLFETAARHRVSHPNGAVQVYLWRTAEPRARGRILLVHGWSGRAMVMGLFVKPLLTAGFDVIAIDLPAQGLSDGSYLNLPIGARAVVAVDRAFGPITGTISHSFGGPVVALAAEGGPPLDGGLAGLERLVLIASPNRLDAMIDAFARRNRLPDRVRGRLEFEVARVAHRPIADMEVARFVERIGKPTLVVHDEGDEDVPFARAETIAAASPHATLMRTRGLGHRLIVVTPGVVRASVRFLAGSAADGV